MFDYITIRQQNHSDSQSPLDLGFLAEAMLFYGRVRVIADPGIFRQLVFSLGPDLLLEFLEEGFLELTYLENNLGIQSPNTRSPVKHYQPVIFSAPRLSLQNYVPAILQEATGKQGRGRRLANRMVNKIEAFSYSEDVKVQARQDLTDAEYVRSAAKQILSGYAPDYRLPDPFEFSIVDNSEDFSISTNIDFEAANVSYHRLESVDHSTLSPAYFLSLLMTTRSHLLFASENSAELALEPVNASLVQLKISSILNRRMQSADEVELFQEFVLGDTRAVREVINQGQRSFDDLIDVLKKARKFKEWIAGKDPENSLLKEYYQETIKDSWIEQLPWKISRWSAFTLAGGVIGAVVAGPVGLAAGPVLAAADAFLLDPLIKGWKPSSFVNSKLKPFVEQ